MITPPFSATGPPVYVDETAGSDETGTGTEESPFASPVGALLSKGAEIAIHIRKGPSETYSPLGTSALKKAKKTIEINEKKAKKAEDNKDKNAKEAAELKERDAKRLEESKQIVLAEDATLPAATKVSHPSLTPA